MVSAFISPASVVRSIIAVIVLLVVAIIVANILGGLAFLGLVSWLILVVGIVVGAFLIARAGRPLAGAGAIILPLSAWIAFHVQPPAFVWTALFFIGAGLIIIGTRDDTPLRSSWPLLLPRVIIGWALVDNSQDHFLNNWLPGVQGTGFFQSATGVATRQPRDLLDSAYQAFVKAAVAGNPDPWAGLTICGELSFGLLLAAGFLTPIGALGAMWLNGNYMLMRGFANHGGYVDKVFFAGELFSLIVMAGLAYGLDATLRRHVPSAISETLMGTPGAEPEQAPLPRPEPQPT